MITWSNGYLTATVPNASSSILATQGKSDGKWYFEFTNSTENSMFGISISASGWNGVSGVFIYVNNGNICGNGGNNIVYSVPITSNSIVGVAIDLDLGTVNFSINGVFYGKIVRDILKNNILYPAFSSGGSSVSVTCTANFGAKPFSIIKSDPEEWNKLVSEGYLPYDIESASWFNCSLLKSNNKYYIYQNNEFIEVEPTIENFENNYVNLSQLVTPTNKVMLTMDGGEVLEDGKLYRKIININKYKDIEKIEVK
jgi:hypothetical protein